jgi:L-aminopeptidase/D-esterase-like protein
VPIVPAAILFDLGVGDGRIRPDAAAGHAAARAASSGAFAEGNVGAGAGATVGKLLGFERAMRGGLGSASERLPDGLIVAALVAVNAVGDVRDPRTGMLVAGARAADGLGLADTLAVLRAGGLAAPALGDPRPRGNTTIGVVATNAALGKAELAKVAQMAQDGLARTIQPVHTPWDGDTLFALGLGGQRADVLVVGTLAAEAVANAVLRAVRTARSLPGLPAAGDLAAQSRSR